MKLVIIVEGQVAEYILQKLLPSRILEQVNILVGGGRSNAESLAKTILVTRKQSVVLIRDTDTLNEKLIQDQLAFADWYFSQSVGDIPYKVILARPEIEIIFFQYRDILEKLLQYQFTDMEWELALAQPSKVLRSLTGEDNKILSIDSIVNKLNADTLELLNKHPIIQELIQFVDEVSVKTNN
jgi:hypothetical protein